MGGRHCTDGWYGKLPGEYRDNALRIRKRSAALCPRTVLVMA
ncbi:hypothetical protein HMPREF1548_04761 [Clostridium sp. KLE 1755]|nr:hypothetical protein HMPREF1548_04761 [Clostridium sp. KLE 1755]